MTVHLVNLTNPMMMKGPIREIIPITAQQVSLQIPAGRRVKQVQLLVAGTNQSIQIRRDASSLKCRPSRCMRWLRSISLRRAVLHSKVRLEREFDNDSKRMALHLRTTGKTELRS